MGRTFEQAYLYTDANGAWRVLPICWSIERSEWDLTHEVLDGIAGHSGAVTAAFDTRDKIFNDGCGQCHATDFDVGFRAESGTFESTLLEGAVACESCHGPGSVHVLWHERERDEEDYEAPARLLHPRRDLDAAQVLHSCGRCHYLHEWRYAIDPDPRVSYLDVAISTNRDSAGFFADGRLSGQRYHGSTQSQSPCFLEGGMSCLHCHRMHSGRKRTMRWDDARTNRQCLPCHEDVAQQGEDHTFHAAENDLRCVDCHMPRLVSGVLHFMHDHRIRSPEPELTERYGAHNSPNACNACHKEKTIAWARKWKEEWWGKAPRSLVLDVGTIVDLRDDPAQVETARLTELAGRPDAERFFRMTALTQLARRPDDLEARAAIRAALADADPEMVQQACIALAIVPDPAAGDALEPLLEHPVRTIRVEAAYALARAGWRPAAVTPALERVWRDAQAMFIGLREYPNLMRRVGLIASALGKSGEAAAYLAKLLASETRPRPSVVQLMHQHARTAAEAGQHSDAMALYTQVRALAREIGDEDALRVLFVDSADSLYALGVHADAVKLWRSAAARFTRDSVVARIAQARLDALAPDGLANAVAALEALAGELERSPVGGEMLRRVRWSLRVLAGRSG